MKKGFSTLLIVIIIGSISLSFALWISKSSFWSVHKTVDSKNFYTAKAVALTCAETALGYMMENVSYIGSGNISMGGGECSYSVVSTGGNSREISVTATVKDITRRISIITDAFNPIHIVSWVENH